MRTQPVPFMYNAYAFRLPQIRDQGMMREYFMPSIEAPTSSPA
jgi:hypothetical protein